MVLQMGVNPQASSLLSKSMKALMEAAIVSKCKHQQSHFDFLNTVSKKNSYWVSLFKRNGSLAEVCFS
jgi:hypothetical protein